VPDLQVSIANQIATSAAQTTLSVQELITTMKTSGMADSAIKQALMSDLNTGGPLFGAFRNKLKNTVRNGVELSSNGSSNSAFTKAGVQEFQWVSVGDGKVCPDCEERHGETGTMEFFETIGLPASGFSVCTTNCRCQLLPQTYKGENLDKPLVKGKGVQWSPSMTEKNAQAWSKGSSHRETVYHTTSSINEKALRKVGFDLDKTGMGRFFGDGVYTSADDATNYWYAKKYGQNAKTVKMKINVRNTIKVDLSGVGDKIGWHDQFINKIDDIKPGFKRRYKENLIKRWKFDNKIFENAPYHTDELWDTIDSRLGDYLTKDQIRERSIYFDNKGFISSAELQESKVLTQTLKGYGYDSLQILDNGVREFIGGGQMIIFDPRNIVIHG